MEYQRDEHRVHLVVYHLIWCPKRRKKVLCGDVKTHCESLLRGLLYSKGMGGLKISNSTRPHSFLCACVADRFSGGRCPPM